MNVTEDDRRRAESAVLPTAEELTAAGYANTVERVAAAIAAARRASRADDTDTTGRA